MSNHYYQWPTLADCQTYLVAIEVAVADRPYLFRQFVGWSDARSLPLYLWNAGYRSIQTIRLVGERLVIESAKWTVDSDILYEIGGSDSPGIFLVEGIAQPPIAQQRVLTLQNCRDQLEQTEQEQYVVLLDDTIDIPPALYPLIPRLVKPVPTVQELEGLLQLFCDRHPDLNDDKQSRLHLIQACTGLPEGEIQVCLDRYVSRCSSSEALCEQILEYKKHKLAGRGVRILGEPDVPEVAGLDLLRHDIDKIATLFEPRAKAWRLRNPNGGLLWGLPGTGKTLVAKTIAKRLHATMIAVDFNKLFASTVHESLKNLKDLLHLADTSGNCVLFADEFEKNFAGWDSGAGGGVMSKMTGELLTWMQDHESPVFFLAAINRLGLLPAELVRRFNYVWFVGNPHDGALYEIFKVHFSRFIPDQYFSDDQWRVLLDEYRGCTPDEVGKATERTIQTIYYRHILAERETGVPFDPSAIAPELLLEDLLHEREQFTPASANEAVSNQLYSILKDADFARPVSGRDRSRFARAERSLFEASPDSVSRTIAASTNLSVVNLPPI
ncbi:MAG: AAA family ATPase [Cyanobacteria bacterium P01_F01_bin.150]